MKLTRRQVLGGAAAGALGAAGVYELVDRLASSPERPATAAHPPEQHVLDGVRVVEDGGVEVLVPPLHHEVVTTKVAVDGRDLRDAQRALEDSLRGLDKRYQASPAGLGVTVAWGLPYFETHVADAWRRNEPRDRRAERAALLPTRRFPSDPAETVLEENDVAILLRSDAREHIEDAAQTLFEQVGAFRVTSIRKGFAGGGFDGGSSLPKRLAMAAGVPGADLIPDGAELFLGFTSTQRTGLGPRKIVNFETLGLVDVGEGYFREGTHMHLSHIHEQLDTWYQLFDFRDRVDTTFRPGLTVAPGTLTVRQAQDDISAAADVAHDFDRGRTIGHSAALQTASRLHADHVAEDGVVYPAGTAIPHRADFNTLDNPFFWSAAPERDGMRDGPAAGVHFVVFNPSSDDFERIRFAMDGVLPDGTKLEFEPGRGRQGFNSVLRTTHRQNFLVPPRRHRSFPLAEIPV